MTRPQFKTYLYSRFLLQPDYTHTSRCNRPCKYPQFKVLLFFNSGRNLKRSLPQWLGADHWWIQGGAVSVCPPTGSISFVFAYVFAKKCTCRRSAPPQQVDAPPQQEILDPPLLTVKYTQTPVCFFGM